MPKPTVLYQYRIINHDLDGMHFCWNNIWHGWGNNQAYALLETYKITANPDILKSVQLWADCFIPFLIDNNFPRRIELSSDGTYQMATYPQIAYGINSLYRGVKTLAEITGKPLRRARSIRRPTLDLRAGNRHRELQFRRILDRQGRLADRSSCS